nr:PIN domain-containing protein [Naumannella cuiyingiana]
MPVFLDTNVIDPVSLADTLMRLAEVDVIRPHWSADVMAELVRNLGKRLPRENAAKRALAMEAAFPEAMVTGYESLVDGMTNDPKDRHVLAAAVHSDCQVIVTFNTGDFPDDSLAPHDLVAVHPDAFLLDQLELYPQLVRRSLQRQSAATARPRLTLLELIEHFERIGLRGFATELRRSWPDLTG